MILKTIICYKLQKRCLTRSIISYWFEIDNMQNNFERTPKSYGEEMNKQWKHLLTCLHLLSQAYPALKVSRMWGRTRVFTWGGSSIPGKWIIRTIWLALHFIIICILFFHTRTRVFWIFIPVKVCTKSSQLKNKSNGQNKIHWWLARRGQPECRSWR